MPHQASGWPSAPTHKGRTAYIQDLFSVGLNTPPLDAPDIRIPGKQDSEGHLQVWRAGSCLLRQVLPNCYDTHSPPSHPTPPFL